MKHQAFCLGLLLAAGLAVASVPAMAGDYGSTSSGGYGRSGDCYKCPAPRNYDSQEVLKKSRDVDHSRVIDTQSVVPSKRVIETNHLVVHENQTRNVGTVQHNHTVIEKELILKKNNVDHKYINSNVNQVEHRYNTERKRIVEEREIPGEVRHLRDCNCDTGYKGHGGGYGGQGYGGQGHSHVRAYGMASNNDGYGSSSGYARR